MTAGNGQAPTATTATTGPTGTAAPNAAAVPTVHFTDERLGNGLRLIMSPDPLAPVAAVNIWYNVGSRHEVPGQTGLAHLFEHMMFQGSRNVGKAEHFRLISGAGGTLNGTTWVDRTNYFETVPSHHLELVLWLEADRMGTLLDALGQETLDNQREVVKNEKRQSYDNRPYGSSSEKLQAAVFPEGHPYHHSTIGSMADLDAASLEDVQAFFRTYYAPNNATLSIVGDFEPDVARGWVEKHFGPIPANPDLPAPPEGALPPHIGAEVRQVVPDRVPMSRLYFGYRAPPFGTPGFDALTMATIVLAQGKGSRLYNRLVRGKELAQDVGLGAYEWIGGAALAMGWSTARNERELDALEDAYHEGIAGLAEDPPTEEEMTRARAIVERDELEALQRVAERADRLSMHATLFDDPGMMNDRLPSLLAVTPEQIQEATAAILVPENRVVLRFVPKEAR
ncbi:MAG TPA: pitrilysin family protein [Actinomycetota bacterium]